MEIGVNRPTHTFFDRSALSRSPIEQQHLSIQLGLEGFSFCIRDASRVLAFESYHQALSKLEETIADQDYLHKAYHSVNINFSSEKHTLIPASIYEPKRNKKYLKLNHHKIENQQFLSDKLKQIDAFLVYAISEPEMELINLFFPNANLKHYGTTLIESLLQKPTKAPTLYINIAKRKMDVLVIKNKELQLYNTFTYKSAEDFIYFALFVCEQLDLDPDQLDCCFFGEIEKNSSTYDLAHKYIRHIRFIKRNEKVVLSPVINRLPEYYYYPLLHQHLCV